MTTVLCFMFTVFPVSHHANSRLVCLQISQHCSLRGEKRIANIHFNNNIGSIKMSSLTGLISRASCKTVRALLGFWPSFSSRRASLMEQKACNVVFSLDSATASCSKASDWSRLPARLSKAALRRRITTNPGRVFSMASSTRRASFKSPDRRGRSMNEGCGSETDYVNHIGSLRC